ncbi:MAG: aromatic-ring-hydroxylating dioxygenase subunit beta [Alphaproteobacteria bacterium]
MTRRALTGILEEAPPSVYINDRFYQELDEHHTRGRGRPDAQEMREEIANFLAFEGRLLDEQRFEEWLELMDDRCLYWVPSSYPPDAAGKTVSVTLDDRRRLLDRIARLRTGYAYSQEPPSRTQRSLSSVEVWHYGPETGDFISRASFQVAELRNSEITRHHGIYEHVLRPAAGSFVICQKRIILLNADEILPNVSFIF